MIGQRDPGGVEHLQEKIPYQAMSLFDFIKQEDAALAVCKYVSQPSGSARFVPQ